MLLLEIWMYLKHFSTFLEIAMCCKNFFNVSTKLDIK